MEPLTMKQARAMFRRQYNGEPEVRRLGFRTWARQSKLPTRKGVRGASRYWKINDIVEAAR